MATEDNGSDTKEAEKEAVVQKKKKRSPSTTGVAATQYISKRTLRTVAKRAHYEATENLLDELAKDIHEYLITGKCTSTTKISNYINTQFALLNTAKDSYNAVNNLKFLAEISESTQKQIDKKRANDKDYIDYYLYKCLMPWQRDAYMSYAHRVSMLCGRRSGKSFLLATLMVKHATENPDVIEGKTKNKKAIYIGLTLEKAATVMWSTLKTIAEKSKAPVKHIDNSKYIIEMVNGNIIQLVGNSTKAEREKIRGDDFSMCCIDEMQSQQGVGYLLNSIVGPIIKGRNGFILYSGTAPLTAGTYWEQIVQDSSIEQVHATMEDNITIPNYSTALADVLKENKWSEDNIIFRREYKGEIAYDTTAMVYPKRLYYDKLPDMKVKHIQVGVDYGYRDAMSLAPVIIYEDNSMYLAHEFKQAGMATSAVVAKIKEMNDFLKATYHVTDDDIWFIQDTNDQGAGVDVFNSGVKNIYNAYKQGENYQIALVKDALESGQLLIKKGDHFDSECDRATWKIDPERNTVIYELDDANFHMDIGDSVKYAVSSYISNQLSQ